MTEVYFIRHAESDHAIHDEFIRPLTPKGMLDRKLVTRYLSDKNISKAFSSPYVRAVDTIRDFTEKSGLSIETISNFMERKAGSGWIKDFYEFAQRQWTDFDYKLPGGESLREVQDRNIQALNIILEKCRNQSVIIGTHGTALCSVLHYYDPDFGFADFIGMVKLMPWIVKLTFEKTRCIRIEKIDLLKNETVL